MKSHTLKVGLVWTGISVAFLFLCILWGWIISDPTLQILHLNLLKIAYPGFTMTLAGMLIALAEAVLYGFSFGILYVWLCKMCCVHNH